MKVAILGCNGGTDLAFGGGANVASAMAHCLENRGLDVHMISVIGLDKHELTNIHKWSLGPKVSTQYLVNARKNPRIPYAISLKMIDKLSKSIENIKPDVVIYNDDVPKSIHKVVKRLGASTIVYIHFSYYVRQHYPRFQYLVTEWNPLEAVFNYLIIPSLLLPLEDADTLITNSYATKIATQQVIQRKDIKVLNPPLMSIPVPPEKIPDRPKMAIHAARQDRTFLNQMLIDFIARLRNRKEDINVIVNRNKSKGIAKLSRDYSGIISTDFMPHNLWDKILRHSRYYLHFKWLEGFGIATAEAISKGAIPIVFKSPLNGSWTDLARECNFCGFKSADEALNTLEDMEADPQKRLIASRILNRKLKDCDISNFQKRIISYIK